MTLIHFNAKKPITYAIKYRMELISDQNKKDKKQFISFVSPSHFKPHKLSSPEYKFIWNNVIFSNGIRPSEIFFPTTYKDRILYNETKFNKVKFEIQYVDQMLNLTSAILLFKSHEEAKQFLTNNIWEESYLKKAVRPFTLPENSILSHYNPHFDLAKPVKDPWYELLEKDAIFTDNEAIVCQQGYCDQIGWLPPVLLEDTLVVSQRNISDEDYDYDENYSFVSGIFYETYTITPLTIKPTLDIKSFLK